MLFKLVAELAKEPAWKVYKGLVINCSSLAYSVVNSLVAGKLSKSNVDLCPLTVHQSFSIDDAAVLNLFECSEVSEIFQCS